VNITKFKKKKILIKTYLFESGLFYLGKSLYKELVKNNEVYLFPKEKYKKTGRRFVPFYPPLSDKGLLSGLSYFEANSFHKNNLEKFVIDKDVDIIFSLETFMPTASWIDSIKSKKRVRIYDIPMPEWVDESHLKRGSYNRLDGIISLTKTTTRLFGKTIIYETSWDYANDANNFISENKKSKDKFIFYHQASLNPSFSQKNTKNVLLAFQRFSEDVQKNVQLIVTGRLSDKEKLIVKKSNNIMIINEILNKEGIYKLYEKSDCVIAPSTREGLGLTFYEAKKFDCEIITTNADPMNIHTDYLCKVISYNGNGLIAHATTSSEEILKQLNKYYEENLMAKKTKEQIESENKSLLEAFGEASVEGKKSGSAEMDMDVLSKLNAKLNSKNSKEQKEEEVKVISQRSVSIEFAVVGVGQAGSRLAEAFHKKGYDVGVINTSAQDLEFIEVADHQKLLLEGSLGGTGKDLDLGREIFDDSQEQIVQFLDPIIEGNNMVYITVSGGGGTGSSSVDTMVTMLFEAGIQVGVIYVLPKATEDAQSKKNSIETLSRLAKMTVNKMVVNLIVVDNARIEQIYADLSQSKFWEVSNEAIIEPLHVFNTLTCTASKFTSLDPSDFAKIIAAGNCSTYGVIEVEDYMEETALAEAVISSLGGNMLASGFDLSQTRAGGVIITGPESALERLPALNINYCFHIISQQTNGASIFQGVYSTPSEKDSIKIYSWFAGLGLPKDRVENLKRESEEQALLAESKEKNSAATMTLDFEEDQVNATSREINRKIKKKNSAFSRMQRSGGRTSLIDRRKRKK
tara:strand:- start:7244 stop:9649 length:2406 start_codon:yes stop_codon:yes gene_type:complete